MKATVTTVSCKVFVIIALSFCALRAHCTTYFVATSGNDANNCKAASTACKTIPKALTVAVTPGDIVQVAPGTYTGNVSLTHPGSASAPITLRGQNGSGCPTTPVSDVNSPTGTHPNSAVTLVGSINMSVSYLAVDCFHIIANGNGGVGLSAGTTGGTITNNEIDGSGNAHNGGGIGSDGPRPSAQYASNYRITANYIHGVSSGFWIFCNSCTINDNEIMALQGDEPGNDHDYIDLWGIGTKVSHNYMHGNTCNACNGYDCHMDCIQTFNTTGNGTEVSKNITFDRNVCFNHHEGVILQDNAGNGDVSGWTISNNVFAYGPYDDGSGHLCQAGTSQPWCWILEDGNLGNTKFYNNTCIDGAEGFRNNSGTADYKDNLFYSSYGQTTVYQNAGANVTGANNLYFSVGTAFGSGTFPGDIVDQDPKIISIGTGNNQCVGCNYNIQLGSAAINAGVSTNPTVVTDLIGTPRPQGSAYDIGAYEYKSAAAQPKPPTGLGAVIK